ncbi:unnamed protein product, partial [Iphiclides podalirius]
MGKLRPGPCVRTVMRTCDAEGFKRALQKDPKLMVGRLQFVTHMYRACDRCGAKWEIAGTDLKPQLLTALRSNAAESVPTSVLIARVIAVRP